MGRLFFASLLALVLLGSAEAQPQHETPAAEPKTHVTPFKEFTTPVANGVRRDDANGVGGDDSNGFGRNDELPAAPVPEPATLLLLGSGVAGMFAWRKFRSK